ncbi:MAG TPA: efflux RND transporter periplasmic adaptor subunit [Vicinamibacterales bacterium]|jgi:RND family efflux transporter MFP subunit|nr:efflux RND transporter periplasmic adaptor subunit [Vicinamibacterales bacterium]
MTKSISFVALLAATLASGCTKVEGVEAKPARPVKTQAVTMAPAATGIRYSATIEAFQEVPLAFKASGYVDELIQRKGADGRQRAAQAGDQVSRGTVLARVHQADYQEKVNQGRAKLAEGEASLRKASLDLERAKTLFAADSLIKPDLDSAQANFDSAQARVTSAQADIELALSAFRDTTLISPASGILLERKIEVGTLVGAGTVGFVLGDVSAVKARFGIPDAAIATVKLGENIGVTVEAVAEKMFTGRITAVAPTADPQSRVFDVEVTIPNTDGRLRPGMIGTVALGLPPTPVQQPLTVPLSAVIRATDSDSYALMVVERKGDVEIAHLRRVELGDVLGNGVAVTHGIAAGDRVVVTGASLLVDGDPVRVIP